MILPEMILPNGAGEFVQDDVVL